MKTLVQKHTWLGSSADPQKLSMTWQGIFLGLIPVAVTLLGFAEIDVTSDELTDLVNTLFAAIASVTVLAGALRKFYYKVKV